MANTWTLNNQGIVFAASKVMAGIFNAGTRVLRIARMGLLNNQTAAITGVACLMEIRKYPATMTWTTPTAVVPVAHDSTNSALSSVTAGNLGTPGGSTPAVLRRIFWSSDEPSISTATSDELECFVPLNVIWDAGYGDSTVQKVALRTGEGFLLYNTTGAVGLVDIWTEFLDEAS
jgi:hypothetical protein